MKSRAACILSEAARVCSSNPTTMEFWGIEIPSGKPVRCDPGDISYIHVSQAALGECKSGKGNERVVLKVKVNDKEVVVATLSHGKCDQTTLDLIFDEEFSVSHNGSASVYLAGYITDAVHEAEDFSDEDDQSEEEDVPKPTDVSTKDNGKQKIVKVEAVGDKSDAKHGEIAVTRKGEDGDKAKELGAKGKKAEGDVKGIVEEKEEDEDEDEDEDEEEESEDEDEDMSDSGADSEEDEEESSEEDTPIVGKKRPLSSPPVGIIIKKSKVETPQGNVKADKKYVSLPSAKPSPKEQRQTPGKENKTKTGTPKSEKKTAQFSCQRCNKNFTSEVALNQHNTAKHK